MLDTTLLLLIIPDHESSKSIVTGKIFEYIATGKPVICIGPEDGDAAELINQAESGKTFKYDDFRGIYDFVKSVAGNKITRNEISVSGFSRKNLTAKIASILRDLY
jgi:glycosyltransferase involved in cell wall biosynthesis